MNGPRRIVPSALSALAATLVLVALLSGCGSSNKATTTGPAATASWADGMCSSLVTWKASVKSAGAGLTKGDVSKASLQKAAEAVSTANAKLKDDLQALGSPPTPAAKEAKAALDELSASLKTNVAKIEDALAGVSGLQDLPAVAPVVTTTLSAMSDDFSSTAKQLQSLGAKEDWQQAFAQSDSCRQLTGG